jgi:BON domain
MKKWLMVSVLGATAALAAPPTLTPVENHVRHELVMLPYLNVFDDISFRVDGNTVTLFGEVTRPVLKSDAENVVKRVEGIARVENQIEVLPLRVSTTPSGCERRGRFMDTRRCSDMERERSRRFTSS